MLNINSLVFNIKFKIKRFLMQKGIYPNAPNYINKFVSTNYHFWKKYNNAKKLNKSFILSEYQQNVYIGIGISALAKILSKKYNAKVLYYLHSNNKKEISNWIQASFGGELYISNNNFLKLKDLNNIIQITNSTFDSLYNTEDILKIKYNNVTIGSFIYDDILRYNRWKASVWEINNEVYEVIKNALTICYFLDKLNNFYNIKSAVFSHSVGKSGLILKYLSSMGIETYCGRIGARGIRKYNKHTYLGWITPLLKVPNAMFYKIINNEDYYHNILQKAKKYLNQRIEGALKDTDSQKAFSEKKKIYTSYENFCKEYNLSTNKPIVFVMLHAFNDFPHHFKWNLFKDYYEWFKYTLEYAQANNSVNWVFKEHPSAVFYPDDVNLNDLFKKIDNNNITFLNRDSLFNTISIKYIGYCTITCIGTAALELSSFGIPAIIAGENHFSGYNICYEPQKLNEYKEYLLGLGNKIQLKNLNSSIKNKASILFFLTYYYFGGNTPYNDHFIPPSNHEERLKNNSKYVTEYMLKDLYSHKTYSFIKKIEKFVENSSQETLATIDDII